MIAHSRFHEGIPRKRAGALALFAVAALVGNQTASGSPYPGLAVGALILGVLVLQRKLRLLVPFTTLALAMGSSTLPFAQSSWMLLIKFGLMASVAATALPALLERRRDHLLPARFNVAFFGLSGLALLSSFYSVAPAVTIQHAGSLLILGMAATVAIPLHSQTSEDFMRLVRNIAWVAACVVLAGFALSATNVITGFQIGRFHGMLGNPNTLGYFTATILPATILMAAHQKRARMPLMFVAAVLMIGLLLSGSRGGLLSALFGTAVGLTVARRAKKGLMVVLVSGALIAGVILVWESPVRPIGEGLLEIGSGSQRIEAWPDGLRIISERPLTGYGFAATPVVFPELRSAEIFRGVGFGRLHNSYLEAAMDLGWPGAVFLLTLALSGLVAAWRVARINENWRPVGAVLFSGIGGGMMEGFFESGLLAAGGLLAFHFWIMVAAAHTLKVQSHRPATVLP